MENICLLVIWFIPITWIEINQFPHIVINMITKREKIINSIQSMKEMEYIFMVGMISLIVVEYMMLSAMR